MTKTEQALHKFANGYNCAQAVFSVFAAEIGLSETDCERLSMGFGGGMARLQDTCGVLTGAFLIIGAFFGQNGADKGSTQYNVAQQQIRKFMQQFRDKHQHHFCRQLLGYDVNDPQQMQQALDNNAYARCKEYIASSIELLETLLQEPIH